MRRFGWEGTLGVGEVDREVGAQARALDPIEHRQKAGAAALERGGWCELLPGLEDPGRAFTQLGVAGQQGSRVTRARAWPLMALISAMNSASSCACASARLAARVPARIGLGAAALLPVLEAGRR